MWLTNSGKYLDQKWSMAAFASLIFAFIPLLGWVSAVIIAFSTLRKEYWQGVFVLIAALIPQVALSFLGKSGIEVISGLSSYILTWILALILREKSDWGIVLTVCIGIILSVAIALRFIFPDLNNFWYHLLQNLYAQADQSKHLMQQPNGMQLTTYLKMWSAMMTAVILFYQAFFATISLLLGRWWQAKVFNPGGLNQEIRQMQLGYVALGLSALVGLLMAFHIKAGFDTILVVIMVYFWLGMILVHAFFRRKQQKTGWLWVFYGVLVILFPYSLVFLAGIGISDTFIDFRARYA